MAVTCGGRQRSSDMRSQQKLVSSHYCMPDTALADSWTRLQQCLCDAECVAMLCLHEPNSITMQLSNCKCLDELVAYPHLHVCVPICRQILVLGVLEF